jgi:protein arginine kinase activator
MNCDLCENEATVFLTEFTNGKFRNVNLCEHCARERSAVDETSGLELSDLIWGLGNPDHKVSLENEGGEQELLCPQCGFSEADFDKTERLGCPSCYGVYAERLSGMWKNFQSGNTHTGKRPRQAEALAAPLEVPSAEAEASISAEAVTSAPTVVAAAPEPQPRAKKPLAPWQHDTRSERESAERTLQTSRKRLAELQARMAEVLRDEAYEKAAELRDEIREVESLIRDCERRGEVPAASGANAGSGHESP